jgi:serine/threonine protein kinase
MTGAPACVRCGTTAGGLSGACPKCLFDLTVGPASGEDEPTFEQRYVVLNILGRGRHGATYLAADAARPGSHVAVKVLDATRPRHEWVDALYDYCAAIDARAQPWMATLEDTGSDSTGRAFLAVEFVVGCSLLFHCRRECLTAAERLEVFASVASSVAAAHSSGLPHGNLAESNILVPARGAHPVLMDFGLATLCSGRPAGVEDDVAALAALFEALTGDLPPGWHGGDAGAGVSRSASASAMAAAVRALIERLGR